MGNFPHKVNSGNKYPKTGQTSRDGCEKYSVENSSFPRHQTDETEHPDDCSGSHGQGWTIGGILGMLATGRLVELIQRISDDVRIMRDSTTDPDEPATDE